MTTVQTPRDYPFGENDGLDLDPRLAELRRDEPLTRIRMPHGGEAWLVTRYEDVRTVLGDPRFSRAAASGPDMPRMAPEQISDSVILNMDPPDHSRLRKLVAKAFTARQVEQLRPRAQQIVDLLLDRMADHGPPADLVEDLALPLPITVICEMLGVPVTDRDDFRRWAEIALTYTGVTREEIIAARDQLDGYLASLVERHRQHPTDDLLGALVQARDENDRLSERELVVFGVTLLVAGHETTANQTAGFLYKLFTNPDRLAELRADRGLLPNAIEEMLRVTPLGVAGGLPRVATEDVELGGVLVRAGEVVLPNIASGNLDERIFDRPDEIDFHRQHNAHMAFGHGVHHCLGAQLARMELQVAIGSLLDRFPTLRLAVPAAEVPFKHGKLIRGLRALPVTWGEETDD